VNEEADSGDETNYNALNLPGSKRGDDGSRKSKVEVLTMQVSFSPTGREWAIVSGEGLHIYSLDDDMIFDPIALTEAITPAAVEAKLAAAEYSMALRMAIHLNEFALVKNVLEETPLSFYFSRGTVHRTRTTGTTHAVCHQDSVRRFTACGILPAVVSGTATDPREAHGAPPRFVYARLSRHAQGCWQSARRTQDHLRRKPIHIGLSPRSRDADVGRRTTERNIKGGCGNGSRILMKY